MLVPDINPMNNAGSPIELLALSEHHITGMLMRIQLCYKGCSLPAKFC
jgi:hypothetical protein